MPIRQLPPDVINKIAAGEVIERPASVVKELVENALDAGAGRIEIDVRGGGSELIRISDDGRGIPPEQFPLAVASHATSKIESADDLFRVASLGFRGEALASIAAISRFCLRSRTVDSDAGFELDLLGGVPATAAAPMGQSPAELSAASLESEAAMAFSKTVTNDELAAAVIPCAHPTGTTVQVQELFFNTPVRRKFLKTVSTELGHVTEAVLRLALPHPKVHFTLRHNDRLLHDLPAVESRADRIRHFFGDEIHQRLIKIESEDGAARLSGYVVHPSESRPNSRMQYLFLNGRFVRDRALSHALGESYRGLLLHGRQPISFLWLEVPPAEVDVNVHPTKLEVRFVDGGRLYRQLLATLRTRFLATDLTTPFRPAEGSGEVLSDMGQEHQTALDGTHSDATQREFVAWAKGEVANLGKPQQRHPERDDLDEVDLLGSRGSESLRLHRLQQPIPHPPSHSVKSSPGAGNDKGETLASEGHESHLPFDDTRSRELGHQIFTRFDGDRSSEATMSESSPHGEESLEETQRQQQSLSGEVPSAKAMQVHNRYLIAENKDGVVVFDQHALHERVLYEQLRHKVLSGEMESQGLLVPESIDLPPGQAGMVLEQAELFAQLGIRMEGFGGDTILVSSYPAMLANMNIGALVRDVIDELVGGNGPPDRRDLLDDLLHTIACKAAVKAGDRLSPEEVSVLLAQGEATADSHHCPHGRPTALVLTREMLDRQFLRT
ncbi:MAG: DNA mismatch repair endonuclease MutL [Pirellulales bacterium]|nr:DNA mismatch repair endonuclease MutL [Pirellulales bacterium]